MANATFANSHILGEVRPADTWQPVTLINIIIETAFTACSY